MAMLANGQNQTIASDFENHVLEVADECGINYTPCSQGAIVDGTLNLDVEDEHAQRIYYPLQLFKSRLRLI